jgi:hypothetical protein
MRPRTFSDTRHRTAASAMAERPQRPGARPVTDSTGSEHIRKP